MLGVSKHIDEYAVGLKRKFTIFPFYKVLSSPGTLEKNKKSYLFWNIQGVSKVRSDFFFA